jgi:hypothetical protein
MQGLGVIGSARWQRLLMRKFCSERLDIKEYRRAYYLRNKDNRRILNRAYYLQNVDKFRITNRESYAENLDARRIINRDYYAQNKSTRTDSNRRYYLRNKDVVKDYHREYRSRRRDNIKELKREYYLRTLVDPQYYFPRDNDSNKSWKSADLVREYFDSISQALCISCYSDWYRISRAQISYLGGMLLFNSFNPLRF